jgi:hypothetical protein
MDQNIGKNIDSLLSITKSRTDIPFRLNCGVYFRKQLYHDIILTPLTGAVRKECAAPHIRDNGAKIITTMLKHCIKEVVGLGELKDRDIESFARKMLTYDRDDCTLAIKKMTEGDTFSVKSHCSNPRCQKSSEYDISIDRDFRYIPFPEEFQRNLDERGQRFFSVSSNRIADWDDDPVSAVFRFPDGSDAEAIIPVRRDNPIAAEYLAMDLTMLEWNGGQPIAQCQIEELPLSIVDLLSEEIGRHKYGKIMKFDGKCSNCGSDQAVEVSVLDFLFKSSRKQG